MNSLTEKERAGLDEVFLSISSHSRLNIMKRLKAGMQDSLYKVREKTLYTLQYRVKMPKIGHFVYKNHKKKKSLS